MQHLIAIGNLTNDPEVRTTQNGVTVCTFTIAVNRRFAGQNGDKVTDFFRIHAWRQLGEICAKHLAKGKKVAVIGELQARIYDAKNGQQRLSLDVSADEVEFLTPMEKSEPKKKKENSDGYDKTPEEAFTAYQGKLPWE